MSGLFSKPATPAPPPQAPPPPTMSNQETDVAAQQAQRSVERGRTSTLLTGGSGLSDLGDTKKVLLGG